MELAGFPPFWGVDKKNRESAGRRSESGGSTKTTTEILRVAQNDGLGGVRNGDLGGEE